MSQHVRQQFDKHAAADRVELDRPRRVCSQAYCPDSASFTAFLGDVASYTGVVTVGLMLLAPSMFKLLGWRRSARATPNFLLYAGGPFFLLGTTYQAITHYRLLLGVAGPLLLGLTVRTACPPALGETG